MTLTISIACTALILTMIMFTQFKTVDETDITAIETMRETELRTELSNWKEKYEEIEAKLEDRNNKIDEYKQELNNNEQTSNALANEVKEAESFLGYTELQGQGIIVTLKDKYPNEVEYGNILRLVNELRSAGAEAISVNDERLVSTSEIFQVKSNIVLINSKKISGPYTVKAIGDKKYLESALTIKGGYIDEIKNVEELDIEYTIEDNIAISAYNGEQEFKYAKENKDKE